MSRSEFDATTSKAFPPAKAIFTGIGALLAVRVLVILFVDPPSNYEIYRRRRTSKQVTVLSLTSLSASRGFSSALKFIRRFR